jgi:hypothetical protein
MNRYGSTPKLAFAAAAAAIVVAAAAPPAHAYETPSRLNEVSRFYSLGVGEIRCDTEAEWRADPASRFAWSYTNVRHDFSVLPPFLCEGALNAGNPTVPLWQQSAGVWTLVRNRFTSGTGASDATRRRRSARRLSTSPRPRRAWAPATIRRTSSTPTRSRSTTRRRSSIRGSEIRRPPGPLDPSGCPGRSGPRPAARPARERK